MSDIRALLLTDIVDSTRLWETLGDAAMGALWANHDRVARDLIPAWRGREVDRSDGLLLLFASAADAVGYAVAYHRALASSCAPLKARAGLHVGPVILRENSAADIALGAKPLEVEGVAKPVAARVMSIARGGQTLLTAEARVALGSTRLRLQSHGLWRLQGILEPIEVFEAGDAGSPFTPPEDTTKVYRVVRSGDLWLPARQINHRLPAERDAFIGRVAPLDELARRLRGETRLVSVLGMGGTGKTRLVTRFGWNWLGEFPGGVWFCDLSQARSVDGIVNAVAKALDIPLGKDDPVVQLGHAIAGHGECLVILDNFEQVSRHAEETLGNWLGRARQARFVVTTREVLGIAGEDIMALAPLPPAEAAALFVRRAESANRDFRPTTGDDESIATLTRLLDGLPLAIELAAARVRVMPLPALLSRMTERFRLLSSSGGRVDRQATLRALFDWSWDLLSPSEKAALAQLSVFEGGFTLEAAEGMLDLADGDLAPWPLDILQSLLNKSFVRQSGERFELISSVQEYASERLRTPGSYPGSGPSAVHSAEAAHGACFAGLGEDGATTGACIELNNYIAACRRAAERANAEVAVATLEGAWAALKLRGPFRLGVELASSVHSMCGHGTALSARGARVAGRALEACGRLTEARGRFETALEAARMAGDRRCEGQVLSDAGFVLTQEGSMDQAATYQSAALSIARELGDRKLECEALKCMAMLHLQTGRMGKALECSEGALRIARETGNRRLEGAVLLNLAVLHANLGNMEFARTTLEEGLVVAREVGDQKWEGGALSNLGLLNHMQGRASEALELLGAAVTMARELGDLRLECIGWGNLGMVFDNLGRLDEARTHYESALLSSRGLGDRRSEGQFLSYLGLLHARERRFDEARNCLDAGETLLSGAGDSVYLGVLLCHRAEAEHLGGDESAAAVALEAARRHAAAVGAGPESELGMSLTRVHGLWEAAVP